MFHGQWDVETTYDPETGIFYARLINGHRVFVGQGDTLDKASSYAKEAITRAMEEYRKDNPDV